MNITKLTKSVLFIFVAIVIVYFFWNSPLLLIGLILVSAYTKQKLIPINKPLLFFIISGFVGTFGESMVMLSGPWRYSQVNILNFPIWLPFLWGLAGTVGISIYEGLTSKS